jgi:general secretion pathway protein N
MAGIEMKKLLRAFQLLVGAALLGAIATYIEVTRTTAQPSNRVATSGQADTNRIAALPPNPATAGSTPANPRAVQIPDRSVRPGGANTARTSALPPSTEVEPLNPGNPRTAQSPDRVVKPGVADTARTTALPPGTEIESSTSGSANPTTAQPSNRAAKSDEGGTMRTAALPPNPAAESSTPGNPLWALPLKQLSITRDRPIFSPSRRPPPPATPTYVAPVAVRQPVRPAEPERPAVSLLGTVIGEGDRIGVFLESGTGTMIRMRVGEDHQGWVLRLIKAREVTLVKDRELVAVLELPAVGDSGMPGSQSFPGGAMPGAMMPGSVPIAGAQQPGGRPNGRQQRH